MPRIERLSFPLQVLRGSFIAFALTAPAPHAFAESSWRLGIVVDPQQQTSGGQWIDLYTPLTKYVSAVSKRSVSFDISQDPLAAMQKVRTQNNAILIAPAQVIGAALRHGYTPIAASVDQETAVIVVKADSGAISLASLKGKRLVMPQQGALASYLIRGELNAAGISLHHHFSELRSVTFSDASLDTLRSGHGDAAVANGRLAREWMQANRGYRIVYETRPQRAMTIAVSKAVPESVKTALTAAFLAPDKSGAMIVDQTLGKLVPVAPDDFAYVSMLGYATPTKTEGLEQVRARDLPVLLAAGARLFDVRSPEEFRKEHAKTARSLPYLEKSDASVDFDPMQDTFAVNELGSDRSAMLVFACSGPECWKSFKASLTAKKVGFKSVYWFRDGLSGWKQAGLPIAAN